MRYAQLTLAEAFTSFGGSRFAQIMILPTSNSMFTCRRQVLYKCYEQTRDNKSKPPAIGRSWGFRPKTTFREKPKLLWSWPIDGIFLPFWTSKGCTTTSGEIQISFFSYISNNFINGREQWETKPEPKNMDIYAKMAYAK